MRTDVLKGQWKQLRGRIKKHWGRLTDDDILEIRGDRDLLLGKIQALYGRSREEAERDFDRWAEEAGLRSAAR
jgi:uncharacterized protein YjbJ (UPF0337 family)